jgi:signal transduction histidine kinase
MTRSRHFAARATGSKADPFRRARLRLTLLYTAILTVIVALLSASLYEFHSHDVGSIGRGRIVLVVPGESSIAREDPSLGEYLERLGRSIILADIITILAGAGLSSILASRTLRPVKEAVEAEQRFFADAAHDLRTPLAVMRTEAEVAIRSGRVDASEAWRILSSSLEEIQRMSAMVEQMLDLARSGSPSGHARAALAPVDLAGLARNVAEKMSKRAGEQGLTLRIDAPPAAIVHGDPRSLERAVFNVVDNALNYTRAGGSVDVCVRAHGSHVELSVTDTGVGILPDDLPHITEPFFRGDRARGTHAGGAGLGLTIARTAVEESRGTLRAESTPDIGTTVTLRFPQA